MDNVKNTKDLEEDEELAALRLAALATLKKGVKKQSDNETTVNSSIPSVDKDSTLNNSISSVENIPIFPLRNTAYYSTHGKNDQLSSSSRGNQYYWRSSGQGSRRGRGRGLFPNISQRSNLIVITPINTNDKSSEEKTNAPPLILPQHRWCQSVNEESSSPKTYTKRGPTRFNRHESDSDSSDSDYDNSDNGSYSNETILQDEHSVTFGQMTPEESFMVDSEQKPLRSSDRRLSFKDVDSGLFPITAAKDSESIENEDNRKRNDSGKFRNHESKSYSSSHYYSVDSFKDKTVSSSASNDKSCEVSSQFKPSDLSKENNSHVEDLSGLNTRDDELSTVDLQLELKKKMQKLKPDNDELSKKLSDSSDCEGSMSSGGRYRERRKKSKNRYISNSDVFDSNRKKSVSPYRNHGLSSSSSPDSRYKRNWSSERKSRDSSPTHEKNQWSGSSRSSNKNNKRVTSSPNQNKIYTCSQSPSDSNKRNSSQNSGRSNTRTPSSSPARHNNETNKSPSKSHLHKRLSCSPDRHSKQKTNRSPNKGNRQERASYSPDQHGRHRSSRSPNKSHKQQRPSYSPEQGNRHKTSKSPDKNKQQRQSYGSNQQSRHESSISPDKNKQQQKSYSSDRHSRHKTSRSPNKSHKQRQPIYSPEQCKSPSKNRQRRSSLDRHNQHKRNLSPNKRYKHQQHSPGSIKVHKNSDHSHRKDNSCSSEKSIKRIPSNSPVRNHKKKSHHAQSKRNYSCSPDRLQKENKGLSKHKRSYSRSTSSSSQSPERKRSRHQRKFSRSSSSVSSSTSAASSRSSSHSSSPRFRTISSVVKPVEFASSVKNVEISFKDKHSNSLIFPKRARGLNEKSKPPTASVKSSIVGGENLNTVSDGKRLPVHMRLGTLPRNRVIQMNKDVEAAFVNTSSDDDEITSAKCKKQNFRVVTEMSTDESGDVTKRLVEKSFSRNNDVSDQRTKRKKACR